MVIRRRTTLIVAGGVVAILLLALILVVPAVINVDRYRPQLISYLQEKTGKQVEIGRLALTFFPVTIHIDHIGVRNPPIFPAGYVLQVARIDAELGLGALLQRQLVIKSLVVEDAVLNLTSDPDGPWNFENPQSRVSASAVSVGPISILKIKRGTVVASNLLPSDAAGPVFFEAHDISCELEQLNLAGIINPSSSSMYGRGRLNAARLRFGVIELGELRAGDCPARDSQLLGDGSRCNSMVAGDHADLNAGILGFGDRGLHFGTRRIDNTGKRQHRQVRHLREKVAGRIDDGGIDVSEGDGHDPEPALA